MLSASSVAEGPFLSCGGGSTLFAGGNIDNFSGSITSISDTLTGAGVAGSGVLATITFQAIAAGTSPIFFQNVQRFDRDGRISASTADATVDVSSSVPEPSTLVLWSLMADVNRNGCEVPLPSDNSDCRINT